MRTKKFIYNSATTALYQLVHMLIGLILPRLFIITYGSEINGFISSTKQFIAYFSYLEAGLGAALIYLLYKPLANNQVNINIINGIVSRANKEYKKISGIYFLFVIGLAIVYPIIITSENINIATMALLVLAIGLYGAVDFLTLAKYRVLLTADQRLYVISLVSILALIVNFVLTYMLITFKANIILVCVIPVISLFLRSILLRQYVRKNYNYIDYADNSFNTSLDRRYDALIMQLSIGLNLSIPIVVVAIFCSLKEASVFSIYNLVFAGLIGIISIFTTGLSASFGNVIAQEQKTVLRKSNNEFEFFLYMIIGFLYSCAIILIIPFVSVYTKGVTDINYINSTYGILFVIWSVFHNARIPHTTLISAAGLWKETKKVNILQIILLVCLSIILVQFMGITGVLIAMIIAAFYRSIDLIIIVKKILTETSPVPTFFRLVRIFLVIFISYIPFLFWIDLSVTTLPEWFLWACGVSFWCFITTIIINYIFDKNTFLSTIQRFSFLMNK